MEKIKIAQNKILSKTEVRISKTFSESNNLTKKNMLNPELQNVKMEKARTVQMTGTIMTLCGISACSVGYILFEDGMFKRYRSTPGHISGDTYSTAGGAAGLFLLIVGIPAVCIGVPVLLIGTAQRGAAKRNLQMSLITIENPVMNTSVTGLSLKFRF